jgi:hypothetical protein
MAFRGLNLQASTGVALIPIVFYHVVDILQSLYINICILFIFILILVLFLTGAIFAATGVISSII